MIHAARQFCVGRCRAYTSVVECYCCGLDRDSAMVTALQCHNEVNLCRICIGWLMRRAGGVDVTPTLPVGDMAEATRFCEAAGFDVEHYDDGFAFVHFNDQSLFDLDAKYADVVSLADTVGYLDRQRAAAAART